MKNQTENDQEGLAQQRAQCQEPRFYGVAMMGHAFPIFYS